MSESILHQRIETRTRSGDSKQIFQSGGKRVPAGNTQ
jgi:hypothetical protein